MAKAGCAVPEGTRVFSHAYPGLTPWANLVSPSGLCSSRKHRQWSMTRSQAGLLCIERKLLRNMRKSSRWLHGVQSLTDPPRLGGKRLFSLLQLHAGGNGLAVAQYFHLHHFAHLTAAQRVGEIVQIVNRLAAELHQDVARFEACLCRRRSRPYFGEAHAVLHLAEVGNGTEVRPITSATAAHRFIRSEERRVGKECRTRWAPDP